MTAARTSAYAYHILLAIASLAALVGIARAAAIIGVRVPLDPNEGWNAYHAMAAMAGHGLYPGTDSFLTNNYPPLSFYVVGWFGRLTGDDIVAGRLISLAAYLATAGCIACTALRLRCSPVQALFAALYFMLLLLLESDYVAMDDPQMLGHAIDLAALVVILGAPATKRAALTSALLFVLAGFVKHNLLVLPLAVALWLALYELRNAFVFVAAAFALALLGLLLFRVSFGLDLLHALNAPRLYATSLLLTNLGAWLWPAALPLGVAAALFLLRRNDRWVAFCALYVFVGFVLGTYFFGGEGVDVNAMFDCDIALALSGAVAMSRLSARAIFAPAAIAVLYFVPLSFDAIRNAGDDWHKSGFWLAPMRNEAALAQRDIAFLRAARGPAMCEMLSLCYWAGKPAEVDVFNLDQQLRTQARDGRFFIRLLNAHYFAAVELDSLAPFPLPVLVKAAFARNYRLDHVNDEGAFFLPESSRKP